MNKLGKEKGISVTTSYLEIQGYAKAAKVEKLYLASKQSQCAFHLVLRVLEKKKFEALFEAVFNKGDVANLNEELWFFLMCSALKKSGSESFSRYFFIEKFAKLSGYHKNALVGRYASKYSDKQTLEAMFKSGAQVNVHFFEMVPPGHSNFDLMLNYAEPDFLRLCLSRRLAQGLKTYSHTPNNAPRVKCWLKQGYGWWEEKVFPQLNNINQLRPSFPSRVASYDADYLVLAILTGDKALFDECLASYVDVNQRASNGMLPLVEACGRENAYWAVNSLLAKGALVNERDANNFTPLYAALGRKTVSHDLVAMLLSNGADPNHRDFTHATLLYTFGSHLNSQVQKLLFLHGGESHSPYQPGTEFCDYDPNMLNQRVIDLNKQ